MSKWLPLMKMWELAIAEKAPQDVEDTGDAERHLGLALVVAGLAEQPGLLVTEGVARIGTGVPNVASRSPKCASDGTMWARIPRGIP